MIDRVTADFTVDSMYKAPPAKYCKCTNDRKFQFISYIYNKWTGTEPTAEYHWCFSMDPQLIPAATPMWAPRV